MSLNQYVVGLLARGDALARVERRLSSIEERIAAIEQRLAYRLPSVSTSTERRKAIRLVYKQPVAV